MKFNLCLTLLLASCICRAQHDNRLRNVDTLIRRIMQEHHAAGLSVAVVEKGSVIYGKGFGYRNKNTRMPVTPETLFPIGSCTKAFTSALIGRLQIDVDDAAETHLPELRFYTGNLDKNVTLRDMLCHRTGLSGYEKAWFWFNSPDRDSLLAKIRWMKPTAALRARWQYNNFMYLALGCVIEHATGESWEKNVRDRLFSPLNMTRSNTSIRILQTDPDAARGYDTEDQPADTALDYYELQGMAPAGGINSCAFDMAAWMNVWLHGGVFKGQQIIPRAYVDEATSSQMVVYGAKPGSNEQRDIFFLNYGLGWFLRNHGGHYEVEHDGNIQGFSSWVSLFPTDSLGIVVLVNQQNSQVPQLVSNLLAGRILGLPQSVNTPGQSAGTAKTPPARSGRIPGTRPGHTPAEYTGYFENPAYGTIRVTLQNDSLCAWLGKKPFPLKHYHYDVFTSTDDLLFNFRFGNNGRIESLTIPIQGNSEPVVEFSHIERAITLSAAALDKYTGEYELGGQTARVFIRNEALHVTVPGQPEMQLTFVGSDRFTLDGMAGFAIQFGQTNGSVSGFTLVKPDGTSFYIPKKP